MDMMGNTYNINQAKAVTYGAPKTTRHHGCRKGGTRVFNIGDPVTGNGMWPVRMGQFKHDIASAKRASQSGGECNKRNWRRK